MTLLDALLAARPDERVEIHRERWPRERRRLAELAGRVLSDLQRDERPWSGGGIDGEPGVHDAPATLRILEVSEADDDYLREILHFDQDAIWLQNDSQVLRSFANPGHRFVAPVSEIGWVSASGAARIARLVIQPVISELLAPIRLRVGVGPATQKGRTDLFLRALDSYETLGLDTNPVMTWLDPDLEADDVFDARCALAEAWKAHPVDLGDRAIALLCTRLAQRVAAKRRKGGVVREREVINTRTQPLLAATLGSWDRLTNYLGLDPTKSATPPVPRANLAVRPPDMVAARLDVVRAWWMEADRLWSTQTPGSASLAGLTPSPFDLRELQFADAGEEFLYEKLMPSRLLDRVRDLWGSETTKAAPDVLVGTAQPFARMAELLGEAYSFWENIGLTCYYLCHGPYARTSLESAPAYYRRDLQVMAAMNTPVEDALFVDLRDAAGSTALHDGALTITLRIELGEHQSHFDRSQLVGTQPVHEGTFEKMRDVVSAYRCQWIDNYLDAWLDRGWRRDVETAITSYQERMADRDGKPPTLKQAWPIVGAPANRWFGGDYAALADAGGLEGPVQTPPTRTDRLLPSQIAHIVREVGVAIGGDPLSRDMATRRRGELSASVPRVMEHWVITGTSPSPSAPQIGWLLELAFPGETAEGYGQFIEALRSALRKRNHPAADDL